MCPAFSTTAMICGCEQQISRLMTSQCIVVKIDQYSPPPIYSGPQYLGWLYRPIHKQAFMQSFVFHWIALRGAVLRGPNPAIPLNFTPQSQILRKLAVARLWHQ